MRVAVIGAGCLGRALARRLLSAGHTVVFGGTTSAQEAAAELGVQHASNADAASAGDVVVLAVPFAKIRLALRQAELLEGVVLWSCVNALEDDLYGLVVGFDTSAAEEVAKLARGARVVAAIPPFAESMNNGNLRYDSGLTPSIFVCGDDDDAKAIVERLVVDIGAHPVDAGPLASARLVEPAMTLLVRLAYAGLPRDIGLRLLERTR
jgi:8-hydroxy-5-deazaflavin:NADPH oxidoreductase